jgi:hypothetical protein
MPRTIRNKTTRANLIRQVRAGLTKHFGTTPLVLVGKTFKPAALQKFLQADVDANDASTAARASWLDAVTEAKATEAKTDRVLRAIQAQVKARHGEAQEAETVYADFGYALPRKVTRTVDEKAAAVAQAKATREARRTMGPKARAKIRGTAPLAEAGGPVAADGDQGASE